MNRVPLGIAKAKRRRTKFGQVAGWREERRTSSVSADTVASPLLDVDNG